MTDAATQGGALGKVSAEGDVVSIDVEAVSIDMEEVTRAAGSVLDPEIRRTLAQMELLDSVEVDVGGAVVVRYHLTSPLCPSRFAIDIGRDVRRQVLGVPGVTAATVHISDHFLGDELEREVNSDPLPAVST